MDGAFADPVDPFVAGFHQGAKRVHPPGPQAFLRGQHRRHRGRIMLRQIVQRPVVQRQEQQRFGKSRARVHRQALSQPAHFAFNGFGHRRTLRGLGQRGAREGRLESGDPLPLGRHHGNDRHAKLLLERGQINLNPGLLRHVHHVQHHDGGEAQIQQLGHEVEVALQV